MAKLVLTAIGDDRRGLVSALSGTVADHGGNWVEGEMSRLAGKFAGIVLVEVPDAAVDGFRAGIEQLGADGLLTVTLTPADAAPAVAGALLHVELTGHDRPGIVREVSSTLAGLGVSIESMSTLTYDAPMGDGLLFGTDARLILPDGVTTEDVRTALEGITIELMVDVLDDVS